MVAYSAGLGVPFLVPGLAFGRLSACRKKGLPIQGYMEIRTQDERSGVIRSLCPGPVSHFIRIASKIRRGSGQRTGRTTPSP
jgi:hypothetical protein